MKIDVFTIASFVTAATAFNLGLLVLLNVKKRYQLLFGFFNMALTFWALFLFFASVTDSATKAYLYWQIAHAFGIYIAVLFLHTTLYLCNKSKPLLVICAYTFAITHNFLNFSNSGRFLYTPEGTQFLFESIHYLQTNNLQFVTAFSPWILFVLISQIFLYRHWKSHKDDVSGQQALIWLCATFFGFVGGCATFIPMLGIDYYPHIFLLLPIYTITMTYAIVKYHIFDVKIFLEKSILYSILIAILSLLYIVFVMIAEKTLKATIGYSSEIVSLSSALFIGLFFIPIRNKLQSLFERSLFHKTNPELAEENELLHHEVIEKEKYRMASTLASGIAHEIKNPLTAIKTFAEYAPEKRNDPEFFERFSRIVANETDRINNLVHELLDFAKPSPMELVKCDINLLLNECLDLVLNQIHSNNIVLNRELSSTKTIKGDQNQLKQAFINILMNSIEAMPSGGELTVKTRDLDQGLEINISDTGIGIPKEELKHIFEPFHTNKENGTGLGLAITKNIIEKHGGEVEIINKKSNGIVFKIKI